jgi:nucleotide-binding universal stress UspA family protein
MKWIVGLDLRPSSQGAIRFAAWLAGQSRAEDGEELVGIHVLEDEHLRLVLRYHHLDEVIAGARASAEAALAAEGAAPRIRELQVVRGLRAEEALEEARASHGADALIVGRHAGRESHAIVRLGRVARRLLRTLASPVVVVPPDLGADEIGEGPVIALTGLGDDSLAAFRFAQRMARRLGRELGLAHAVPLPEEFGAPYLPQQSLGRLLEENQQEGRLALAEWMKTHGLRADATTVLQGEAVERAVEHARAEGSPLVVTGSRHLSAVERVLVASTGSALAAAAPFAVAVVPPEG